MNIPSFFKNLSCNSEIRSFFEHYMHLAMLEADCYGVQYMHIEDGCIDERTCYICGCVSKTHSDLYLFECENTECIQARSALCLGLYVNRNRLRRPEKKQYSSFMRARNESLIEFCETIGMQIVDGGTMNSIPLDFRLQYLQLWAVRFLIKKIRTEIYEQDKKHG